MAENILEYVLSLKDQVSANLQKIGVNNDTALDKFSKLEKQASKVSLEMTDLGKNAYTLGQKLSLLKNERDFIDAGDITALKAYNSEIKKLESEISNIQNATGKSRISGWFSDAFQSIPFAGLLKNPLVVAGSIAGKALSVGMEADLNKTSFSVMLNSDDAADQLITSLKGIKMDQGALGESAKTMLGFGVATEKVVPMLDAIGNIAGGDAQRVSSLSLAFSQMSSTGKLMGQDLLQMINAGFNPLAEIARTTGRDLGELKEEMAKGNITVEMVEDAFKSATGEGGSFNGMLDKMNETLSGKLQNAMMRVNELLLQLYTVLEPIISFSLDILVGLFTAVTSSVGWFIDGLSELNPLTVVLGVAIVGLTGAYVSYQVAMQKANIIAKAQSLWTGVLSAKTMFLTAKQWLLNVAMNANPIGLIITGITALIALIAAIVVKYDEWGAAMSFLLGPIGMVINAVMAFKKHWSSITEAFSKGGMIAGIKRIGVVLLDALLYPVQQLLKLLSKVPGMSKLADGGQEAIQKIREKLNLITPDEAAKKVKQADSAKEKTEEAVSSSAKEKATFETENIIKDRLRQLNESLGDMVIGSDSYNAVKERINEEQAKLDRLRGRGKGGKNALGKSNESIATGGQKNTTINITFKNMVEAMNITGRDFKESANNMNAEMQDQLLRLLAMASTTAG